MSKDKKYLLNDEEDVNEDIEITSKDPEKDVDKAERLAKKTRKNVIIRGKDGEDIKVTGESLDMSKDEILSLLNNSEIMVNPTMTKSELIESIQKHLIKEARMERDIQNRLDSNRTGFSGHLDPEVVKQLSNEMFDEVRTNVRQKHGKENVNISDVYSKMMSSIMSSVEVEMRHKEELEQLAIQLIRDEYNIGEGEVEFIATLRRLGEVEIGNILDENNQSKPLVEDGSKRDLSKEVTKRRLINSLMHGSARKNQYLYHLSERVNEIDPRLSDFYSHIMVNNDMVYWSFSDDNISMMGKSQDQHIGNVQVKVPEKEGDLPKIIAQGVTFPVLLHELSKGVIELFGLWGLPEDPEERKQVLSQTDKIENETWDIRIGPKIWEKLMRSLPDDAFEYKSDILSELFKLPAEEFNPLIEGIIKGDSRSLQRIKEIAEDIINDYKQDEYDDAMGDNDYDDEDETTLSSDDKMKQEPEETENEDDFDPSKLSKSELQKMIDDAIDDDDWEKVDQLSKFLK